MNPARIIETGAGFWPSTVLLTAVELDVFTTLGARALTGIELQRALGLHSRGVYDFLDTLVALGFLAMHSISLARISGAGAGKRASAATRWCI